MGAQRLLHPQRQPQAAHPAGALRRAHHRHHRSPGATATTRQEHIPVTLTVSRHLHAHRTAILDHRAARPGGGARRDLRPRTLVGGCRGGAGQPQPIRHRHSQHCRSIFRPVAATTVAAGPSSIGSPLGDDLHPSHPISRHRPADCQPGRRRLRHQPARPAHHPTQPAARCHRTPQPRHPRTRPPGPRPHRPPAHPVVTTTPTPPREGGFLRLPAGAGKLLVRCRRSTTPSGCGSS